MMERLKSITKNDRGFTLVELLVVVSIVSVISTIVLVDYRQGVVQHNLSQATQRSLSDLRRVQNMAIGGVDIGTGMGYCGYGVEINTSSRPYSYRIYADKKTDCSVTNNKYDSSDEILEEIELPANIKIESASSPSLDILFKPPEPLTYINQNDSLGVEGWFVLEAEGFDLPTKTIRVNTSGLIQLE